MTQEKRRTRGFGFRRALEKEGLSVIAEIKRRSPSAGILKADLDIAKTARSYREGGAACLSVLTETSLFGGSAEDLKRARRAAGLPVLRKDFITSREDILESREMGADALLLIVADIEPGALRPLHELSLGLGIDVLTEIRNIRELKPALKAGAYMLAVNQRDNPKGEDFSVDFGRAVRMAAALAGNEGIVKVAASGIGVEGGTSTADLAKAGYDAALVGEALVSAADPADKLRSLLSAARSHPPRK